MTLLFLAISSSLYFAAPVSTWGGCGRPDRSPRRSLIGGTKKANSTPGPEFVHTALTGADSSLSRRPAHGAFQERFWERRGVSPSDFVFLFFQQARFYRIRCGLFVVLLFG